jgi:hypothetical protein
MPAFRPTSPACLPARHALRVGRFLRAGAEPGGLGRSPGEAAARRAVIAIAPLPGFAVPSLDIPLNVQSAQADDMAQLHGQAITDLLQSSFQGVRREQSRRLMAVSHRYFGSA